jgi:hypothetical protein
MIEEFKDGYARGFSDGYNKAIKELGDTKMVPFKQQDLSVFGIDINKHGSICHVCGLFFEHGVTYGYVCKHDKCPGNITC